MFTFQMNLLHNVYKILLMLLYQNGSPTHGHTKATPKGKFVPFEV